MKMTRRILSWVLAIALVVTCGITGLVLPVAAEEVTNLFVNGDFEQGASVSWAGSTLVQEGVGKDGGYGYYHVSTTTSLWSASGQLRYKGGALWGKMEAGYTYILSFDYKSNGTVVPQIYFDVSPHEQFDASLALDGTNDEWKTMVYTFIPKEDLKPNSNWEFSFRSRGGAGELWYDNFSLIKAPASVEFASETVKAEVGETVALEATYVNSAVADFTWASNNTDVATVENGVVTMKALGEATISATIGDVTKSVVVSVVKDKTRVDLSADKFFHAAALEGEWAKNDPASVQKDEATGIEYVTVKDAVAGQTDDRQLKYALRTPGFISAKKDEWIGITFLVRVNGVSEEHSGKLRACVRTEGGLADGYHQSEYYVSSAKDWVRHTVYVKSYSTTNSGYLTFYTYGAGVGGVTCTGAQSMDIANVYVFTPKAGEVNLAGAGGDFEDGAPTSLGSHNADGLLHKESAYVTDDPTGADNKVFAVPSGGHYWFVNYRHYVDTTGAKPVNKGYQWGSNKTYKITFRLYNGGSVTVNSYGNTKSTFPLKQGTSSVSNQWRTVTIYMKTAASGNNYGSLHISLGSAGYIDDIAIYEVPNATGFAIQANTEMPINSTQTISYVTIPKHAYPGTVTLSSSESCITVSGTKLTSTKTTGNVTGSTITATSDLLDSEGNPISGSVDITLVYPKEIFTGAIDGTMDSDEFVGFKWYDATPMSVTTDPDNAENKVLKIDTTKVDNTGYTLYFQNVNLQSLKPNSRYRYSFKVKADETVEVAPSYDNRSTDIAFESAGGVSTKVHGEWAMAYGWFMTGDAPRFNSSDWNIRFAYSGSDKSTPIYLDDFSFALIDDYENRFDENGDMDVLDRYLQIMPAANQAIVNDPDDSSNKVLAYSGTFSSNQYMPQIPFLTPWSVYELTFDMKADQEWIDSKSSLRLWWGCKNAELKSFYESGFTGSDTLNAKTTWSKVKITIFNGSVNKLPAESIYFTTSAAGGNIYFDNFSFKRVDSGHSLFGAVVDGYDVRFSVDGGASYKAYLKDVPEGTVVTVNIREHSSTYKRVLKPAVLKTASGQSYVLNKDVELGYTEENFGTGKGRTFEFVMGAEPGKVTATLASATTTNYSMDTLGTSLRLTNTEGVYDGIRFLTRVAMPDGVFLANDVEGFKLLKDGTTYSVVEIGSYLKRYSETTTGEGEAAVTTEDELTAANALWTSVVYKKGEGDMKLLDYTETYIDFTSVMTKGANVEQEDFNARKYTARGYMVLEDAEGNQTTVLANGQTSASVNEIAPLVG